MTAAPTAYTTSSVSPATSAAHRSPASTTRSTPSTIARTARPADGCSRTGGCRGSFASKPDQQALAVKLDRPAKRPDRADRHRGAEVLHVLGENHRRVPLRHGLVAAVGDARSEADLLEQLGHLLRGSDDHLDVAGERRLELEAPLARPREADDRRERRAQVVNGERGEPGEGRILLNWHGRQR